MGVCTYNTCATSLSHYIPHTYLCTVTAMNFLKSRMRYASSIFTSIQTCWTSGSGLISKYHGHESSSQILHAN